MALLIIFVEFLQRYFQAGQQLRQRCSSLLNHIPALNNFALLKMELLKPPRMQWDNRTDLRSQWTRFEAEVRAVFQGPLEGKSEKARCGYLLLWVGDEGRAIFQTFTIEESDKNKIEPLLRKFRDRIFGPHYDTCAVR
ncbi:uncharacterized protein LOC136030043 [Artemia franciscana]|uniref:uncharacterized protein LOC136030043 n=1 Tax=Artemia franciscana TaxID=6661 RepID=UPI0032DAFC52